MHYRHFFITLSTIIAFLPFFVQTFAHAQTDVVFNVQAANQKLDEISKKLSNKKLHLEELQAGIVELTEMQSIALKCESRIEKDLKTFEELSKIGDIDLLPDKLRTQYNKLENQKEQLKKTLAGCRLFIFQSNEALKVYKEMVAEVSASTAFAQKNTIIEVLRNVSKIDLQQFSLRASINDMGLNQLVNHKRFYYVILILFFIGTIVSFQYFMKRYFAWLQLGMFIWPITLFLIVNIWSYIEFDQAMMVSPLYKITLAILIYFISLPVIRFMFYSKFITSNNDRFLVYYRQALYRRTVTLMTVLVIGFIGVRLFNVDSIQDELASLTFLVYLTALIVTMIWLCWPLVSYIKKILNRPRLAVFFEVLITVILFILIGTAWMGYHKLVLLEVRAFIFSIFILAVTALVLKLLNYVFYHMYDAKSEFSIKVHQFFGVKLHKKIYEFNLIRFSLYALIAYKFIVAIMFAWSIPLIKIDDFSMRFFRGFEIFNLKVNVSHIIYAVIIFAILNLIIRIVTLSIIKQYHPSSTKSRQVAVASIVQYTGFSFALLIALLMAGVNFTGLAIIAGALSVGIGLGLQDIVKNFVAGIILLLEKSIKPGDRVVVGETEGHVKKVRIRATQITTLQRSDVIVPNADFITSQVTNYMFRNPVLRIENSVGVAYGSDIEKISKVMLNIAKKHPDVIDNDDFFPRVLFWAFEDSHLRFVLRSFISDVNRKNIIRSEINCKILEAFEYHQIELSFPQLDIHLKQDPKNNKS